ncbi:MAG: S9 family peptidase [Sphingosinicella sp.]|nr:S9 family peptidase [Sphingosinicella sp.]
MRFCFARVALAFFIPLIIIPSVAASPPSIEIYGQLPGLEMAAISPSGERVAIVGVVAEARRLIVADKNNQTLLAIPVGTHKLRDVSWAGEDRLLLETGFTVNLGPGFTAAQAELSQMTVVSLNSDPVWNVFQKARTITGGVRGYYGAIEKEGQWYGYFGGITLDGNQRDGFHLGNTAPELYEVNLETGKFDRIARRLDSLEIHRRWLIDERGTVAATLDFSSRQGDWQIKTPDNHTVVSGRAPFGNVGLAALGSTPGTLIYWVADEETGDPRWIEQPLAGGQGKEIATGEQAHWRLTDRRTRRIIGHVVDGDVPMVRFHDARREKVMEATRKAFPGNRVDLIDWNDAFDRLIVLTEGTGEPPTWWIVDIKSGSAKVLGVSYTLEPEDVGPVRMFPYKAGDGLEMAGVLTLPPHREAKALPVVVLPHGGPAARDYPVFNWWAQAFASRGYAVFQPNFRGSTGLGPDFERAGHGEWGRKMQTDISDGLAELVRQGLVDPKRACIMGASYGGYAALAGVTLQQGLYRCAVSVAGVSDVKRMYITDVRESANDRTLVRSLKAEVGSGRDLHAVSPVRFAERADAPVLLVHGKDDTVVLYEQSVAMHRALQKAGKPVDLVTLKGEDHWLSRSETRLAMLKAAVEFVERHNPTAP